MTNTYQVYVFRSRIPADIGTLSLLVSTSHHYPRVDIRLLHQVRKYPAMAIAKQMPARYGWYNVTAFTLVPIRELYKVKLRLVKWQCTWSRNAQDEVMYARCCYSVDGVEVCNEVPL